MSARPTVATEPNHATSEEGDKEGADETVDDLDPPADVQGDVSGGEGYGTPSLVCSRTTGEATQAVCVKGHLDDRRAA